MKKIVSLALAALLLVSAVIFSSCSSDSDIKAVKDAGKLIVGITVYPPMDYKDDNGEWTGFDAEFARLFAEKLGVEAEFIVIDWDNKLFELSSGAIDCIWNGMTIVDEILNACAVSDPYVKNQQVVVTKSDIIGTYADLDAMAELKFVAEAGSSGEALVEEMPNYTAVLDMGTALLEVQSGSADACVVDKSMAQAATGEGTSYTDLGIALELKNEEYGVAFRQDSDLCAEFNTFMDELIADGTLQALAEKYKLTLAD